MSRMFLSFACAVVLWCSSSAMAFTLQFVPYPAADGFAATQTTNGADVPTPQLFRIVVSHDGVRHETPPHFATYPETAPDVRFQEVRPVRTTAAPHTEDGMATARHLSGAEILLLRQAGTVANR